MVDSHYLEQAKTIVSTSTPMNHQVVIASSTTPHDYQSGPDFRCRTRINVNASKGNKTEADVKLQNAQDEATTQSKRLQQEIQQQHQHQEDRSRSSPEHLRALEEKLSTLELQAILLRTLAAEENNLKGLGTSCGSSADFKKRVADVEEAIRALHF
jgi:hypothetical protein